MKNIIRKLSIKVLIIVAILAFQVGIIYIKYETHNMLEINTFIGLLMCLKLSSRAVFVPRRACVAI